MTAHATDHRAPEPTEGAALLPIFAIATIAICLVVAVPSTVAVVVALAAIIGFATGLVVMLSRLIGNEDH
jgi:ABC-type cobalamin transport system permease subunit